MSGVDKIKVGKYDPPHLPVTQGYVTLAPCGPDIQGPRVNTPGYVQVGQGRLGKDF